MSVNLHDSTSLLLSILKLLPQQLSVRSSTGAYRDILELTEPIIFFKVLTERNQKTRMSNIMIPRMIAITSPRWMVN